MFGRKRRAARRAAEQATWDGRVGAHRLRDGDVVPYANGRTWRDYMTQEVPIIDPPLLTRAGEHRLRRWLR
jgi:hypothetical protein